MGTKEMLFLLTSGRNGQEKLLRKARAVLPCDSAAQMMGGCSRKRKM